MNTIQQAWQTFERDIIPADAPTIQRVEMKRAFYAGAAVILSVNAHIAEEGVSEDAAVAILEGLMEEAMLFAGNPF
jgi:hypothetical protein